MSKNKSISEEVISGMPFKTSIKSWIRKNKRVREALKISHPNRFQTFPVVSLPPSYLKPKDEIVGFFALDKKENTLKQDFIVESPKGSKNFKLYTKLPNGLKGLYDGGVRPLEEFEQTYGKGSWFKNTHHPVDNIPPELKPLVDKPKDSVNLEEDDNKSLD